MLKQDASDRDIKRAYRKLSLKYHPDKAEGDSKMFMRVAKAYAAYVLCPLPDDKILDWSKLKQIAYILKCISNEK